MWFVFLSFPINLPIQFYNLMQNFDVRKIEVFLDLLFVNVFSTFQFSHLAREKISQKTHSSNFSSTIAKILPQKMDDSWILFVSAFSTFQFSDLTQSTLAYSHYSV